MKTREGEKKTGLRRKAEQQVKAKRKSHEDFLTRDAQKLIHELEVHQIELELQNEELRETQLLLEESRNRYVDLYDCAPIGYFTIDKNGMIIEVNLTGADLLGVERSNLLKKRFNHFITHDFQDTFHKHREQVFKSTVKHSCSLQCKNKNGTLSYLRLESIADQTSTGGVSSMRTAVLDISEQQQVEEELKESEELHRVTLNSISDAVFITDDKGLFTFVCPNVNVIFGYSYDEVKAFGTISKLIGTGIFKVRELKTKGEIRNIERDILDKAGRVRSVLISAKSVNIKGGSVLYSCHEITKLRQIQQELKKSHDELEKRVIERTSELMKANAQLQLLSGQLLTSQEHERKRVAQELHDSVGQTLSALKFTVEKAINQSGGILDHEHFQSLKSLLFQIQGSIIEVNRIGRGLRPSMLDDLGVLPALSWFCREFTLTYPDIHISQQIALEEDDIPENCKVVIYRILQESLNNVAKHSKAKLVELSLKKTNTTLEFCIKDNGQWF